MKILSFRALTHGSFTRQIVITFVMGFFFLISAFAVYQVRSETSNLYRDSNRGTTGLAQSLAVSSRSWVLANDIVGLQEVLNSFEGYPGLHYAMVVSPKGKVLAHTDPSKVGKYLTDTQSQTLIEATPEKRVMIDNASMIDVAVPIEIDKRHVGWARVGLGRESIAATLHRMILSSSLFLLISLFASFLAATLIAHRLGKRIGTLMGVAEEVQAGNLGTRAVIYGHEDEVTKLAASFNQMLDTLASNEKVLRSASQYARSLIETSLDPLVTISLEGKITDVNKATESVTGRGRSELVGTDFSNYFTDPEKARDGYKQAFQVGFVTDYPLTIRHRDGHLSDVLYNASIYKDSHGDVQGVFAAARDITERRKAEQQVEQLSLQNKLILDSAGEGIYGLDNDGRCTFVNPAALQLLGFSIEELIGQHSHIQFHHTKPDGSPYPEDECPVQAAHKQGVTHRGADLYWRKDGNGFPVEFVSTPILDAGEIAGAVVVFNDITERKRTEEEQRLLNRELLAISNCNQALMRAENEQSLLNKICQIISDEAGYPLVWVGYAEHDDAKNVRPVAYAGSKGADEYLVAANITWADTVRGRGPCGTVIRTGEASCTNDFEHDLQVAPWRDAAMQRGYRSTMCLALKDEDANTFGALCIYSEKPNAFTPDEKRLLEELANDLAFGITVLHSRIGRQKAEEDLRQYKDHLEEEIQQRTTDLILARNAAETANHAKSVFLANMSHELRTPLNAILGFSSLMRKDTQLRQDQCDNLDIINRSGEHLLTLINDVLEMSKIEAGRVELNNLAFNLGMMVRDVIDMMEIRAKEKGLHLILDQSSQFPSYIYGDEARLRQILINLVGNAVKFTMQGGVTVRLGVCQNTTEQLLIEVEDTGPGIPPEDQKRLFQPFVQLGNPDAQKGTGLGLTITRQYVQLMGGAIFIESTVGKGSVFRVELPFGRVDSINLPKGITHKGEILGLAPNQPEYRVVIAEDQLENQLLLSNLMKNVGIQFRVAENGEQAIQLFQDWQPHLIWMDRRMPVMDGIEATKRIRALPTGKDVKIVAVTASAFTEQRDEILQAGMDDFVRKPYRFNEIYECLTRQLGVQYIYAETQDSDQAPATVALTTEMLSVLPPELRSKLREALESLDADRIAVIMSQVSTYDADLQKTLTHLTENFDYPAILNALQAS